MEGKLTDIATGKLLEKFGAGNHKPGSGSASAMQGMLAAMLLRTVVDLTNEKKRRTNYSAHLPELLRVKTEVESRVYPELESLFQEDSVEFDKVIKLRLKRDLETNPQKKRELEEESREALKIATELPLKIAELCLELGDFASYVFDYGFRGARGDSAVALNSAISGVASCLSIVELNLISLNADEWLEKVEKRRTDIKSRYTKLSPKANEKLAVLEKESQENLAYQKSIAEFKKGNLADSIQSNSEIEDMVRRLQNTLWFQREKIWKNTSIDYPIQILKPDVVLKKVLDYSYEEAASLGMHILEDGAFEIAGLIDKTKKLVQVSKNFSQETQRFTAVHELGHAILHKQAMLHRDKPIDGSTTAHRNLQEVQADKFAAYFLMPKLIVEFTFADVFEMPKFVINDSTALRFDFRGSGDMRQTYQNKRALSRLLASTERYGGKTFRSLAKVFGVSVETMAIRLEELQLLEF